MEQSILTKNLPAWQLWSYFMVLLALSGLIYFLTEKWVLDEDVYRYSLGSKMPDFQIERILLAKSKMGLLGIITDMALWALGLVLLGSWYTLGLSLLDYRVEWRQGFEIALEAALMPLAANAFKLLWFSIKPGPFTLIEYRDTELLSFQHFFNSQHTPPWLWEILGSGSLFEVAYCAMLVTAIKHFTSCTTGKAWQLSAYLYGSFWLCKLSVNLFWHALFS